MRLDHLQDYFNRDGDDAPSRQRLIIEGHRASGRFAGMELHSAFQALFETATLRPVAYEALLRARDPAGRPLSVEHAFQQPRNAAEFACLDRLCRAIHAVNFVAQSDTRSSLFLNVDGRHLRSVNLGWGSTFETLLDHCGLRPAQVVLEIVESRIDDLQLLRDAVAAYQERGYRVAIDDFGCQHSNFDRLWELAPDIVKLDRNLIVQAVTNPRARTILPKLVENIHDLGAQVVCEGIETPEQHALAADARVDLLQGFYFSRPAPRLLAPAREGVAAAG